MPVHRGSTTWPSGETEARCVVPSPEVSGSGGPETRKSAGDQIGPVLFGRSCTPKSRWNGRGVPPLAGTRNIGIRPVGV
jgi:hypothetical protein